MRALTYHGSKDVRIETVPDLILQASDDIIIHRMSLEDAPLGYRIFNDTEENCRKVVLTPGLH